MTIEQTIQKAIEGGYRGGLIGESKDGFWGAKEFIAINSNINDLFLDPLFWQSLGKALGFDPTEKIRMCVGCGIALRWNEQPTMDGKHGGKNGCGSDIEEYEGQWLIEWHRFIDHLVGGGTPESFFETFK